MPRSGPPDVLFNLESQALWNRIAAHISNTTSVGCITCLASVIVCCFTYLYIHDYLQIPTHYPPGLVYPAFCQRPIVDTLNASQSLLADACGTSLAMCPGPSCEVVRRSQPVPVPEI